MLKLHKGATLLELVLILGIGGLMFILGLRLYQSYQAAYQVQRLRVNVDQLFNAANNYYRAHCATGDFSPQTPNILSPYPPNGLGIAYPPTATSYFPVSINTQLIATGFLTEWFPANPYVDETGGEAGYIVQLNPIISNAVTVNACVTLNPNVRCVKSTPNSTIPTAQITVVSWAIQIGVKLKTPSRIGGLAPALGADCISGVTGSTVDPCPSSNASRDYIVWVRMPSYGAIIKPEVLNMPMQSLRQFNKQYTHDANYEFNSGYSTTTTPPQAPVYYLCGG